ncbi:MAG: DUF4157 domain-containing protein [Proteobacteria bacterium]|nr:DUF4157 domain-containing protein [Pseudomonadota bacterium]
MSRKQQKSPGAESSQDPAPASEKASGPSSEGGVSNSQMQELMASGSGLDPVQKFAKAGGAIEDPKATKARAAEGVKGGGPLPYLDKIQAAFGEHDVSGVRATIGGAAAGAAQDIGAKAYAQGDAIAFAESPTLWMVAHEAAHVIQQRTGAAPAGGVGKEGDAGEQGADAVADRVVKGESAADLLGGAGASAASGDSVQKYTEDVIRGGDARVSDTGKSIRIGNQQIYLTDDLIQYANNKLKATGKEGSYVELVAGSDSIKHDGNTLSLIEPKFVPHGGNADLHAGLAGPNGGGKDSMGEGGDKFALWSDCGRSSAAVMGSQYTDRAAVYNRNGKEVERKGMKDRNITGAGDSIPGNMANQVYVDGMSEYLWKNIEDQDLKEGLHFKLAEGKRKALWPKNSLHARQQYAALSEAGRNKVDSTLGINAFAAPDVGEGFTMATEYQMPGAAEVPGKNRWNFHWAGIVAKDGADVISLENYAVTADYAESMGVRQYDFADREWVFQMYGTEKYDQTFHAQHLATGTHGTKATTMQVRTQT